MTGEGSSKHPRWSYLVVALVALSPGCQSPRSNTRTIRIASAALAPLAYRDASGKPAGFYVDVMMEAARREGLQPEYTLHQEGLEATLASGSADVWAAGVANPARRRLAYFTEPWWADDYFLLVTDQSPIQSVAELSGRTVSYGNAPPLPLPIDQAFTGAKPLRQDRPDDRTSAVCRGEVDAALLSQPAAFTFLLARPPDCREPALRLVSQHALQMELSIASVHASKDLADRMHAQVKEMTQDGALARIASKYPMVSMRSADVIRSSVEEKVRQVALERALLAALAFSLLSLYWALRMRRERERSVTARREAERALAVKTEFLATMSHETRTPLTAVVGYLDMLGDSPLSPEQRLLAREGRDATAALLGMMTELLDYSQMQSATVALRTAPCNPATLLDEVVAAIGTRAESKSLSLVVKIGPEVPEEVATDRARVLQILMNLAGNAVKFTDAGTVTLVMHYEAAGNDNGTLALRVADTGPGIPPTQHKLIFEPFTQLDSSDRRRHGGVGLGLAIVRRLVTALGGEINLSSRPGAGTEFAVRIPVTRTPVRRTWMEALVQRLPVPAPRTLLRIPPSKASSLLVETLREMGLTVEMTAGEADLAEQLSQPWPALTCVVVDAETVRTRDRVALLEAGDPLRWVLVGTRAQLSQSNGVSQSNGAPGSIVEACDVCCAWPVTTGFLRAMLLPEPMPSKAAPLPLAPGKPVLVVDDNAVNRKVLGTLLEKLGVEVEFAIDGEEAVRKFFESDYSLVLMDCQMPVLDGFEATDRIRQRSGERRVPIVGVSASVEPATRQRCLERGMDGYLSKPVDLRQLKALLANFN